MTEDTLSSTDMKQVALGIKAIGIVKATMDINDKTIGIMKDVESLSQNVDEVGKANYEESDICKHLLNLDERISSQIETLKKIIQLNDLIIEKLGLFNNA